MTIFVGICIHDKSVIVDEVMMAVRVQLWITTALPLFHDWIREIDVGVDVLHTAVGYDAITIVPYIV